MGNMSIYPLKMAQMGTATYPISLVSEHYVLLRLHIYTKKCFNFKVSSAEI